MATRKNVLHKGVASIYLKIMSFQLNHFKKKKSFLVKNIVIFSSFSVFHFSLEAPWTPKATTIHNQGTPSKPPMLVLFQN